MATKTAAVDAKGYRKFGFRDVLAYGLGDFGCNMSFALKGTLTIFWTQYMGIDSILMASLLLLVQVWDAINDPVIGAMVDADKRQYKRNKFLAYIWAGSVGLLVAGALCFVPWTGAPYVVKCMTQPGQRRAAPASPPYAWATATASTILWRKQAARCWWGNRKPGFWLPAWTNASWM